MASLQIDNCVADQMIEGLDRAIMTMRKGEEARVRICSDYFHGRASFDTGEAILEDGHTGENRSL